VQKVIIYFEVDFDSLHAAPCALCNQPFTAHFQPPPDADPNLAAHWCPNPVTPGAYVSRTYKCPAAVRRNLSS
jgi:hypothetical protein